MSSDCDHNVDLLKLQRDGTHQAQRYQALLNPENVPIDAHNVSHKIIFAQNLSKYIQYYGSSNTVAGDWQPFFSDDVSVLLAFAAIEDVEHYKTRVQQYFKFLNDI